MLLFALAWKCPDCEPVNTFGITCGPGSGATIPEVLRGIDRHYTERHPGRSLPEPVLSVRRIDTRVQV